MKKYSIFACISALILVWSLVSLLAEQQKTDSSHNVMPLAEQVIVLDPGHGGVDGGADYGEDQEKTVTFQTALFLRDYLQEAGAEVVLTREGDYDLAPDDMEGYSKRKSYDIRRRVKLIQDVEADVFVSIHLNSVSNESWRGAQTFYYPEGEENKRLAEAIQQRLKDSIETNRQVLAMDQVYILKHAEATSALVEVGFLSNETERALLTSEDYQRRLASSIYEGIIEYVTDEEEL